MSNDEKKYPSKTARNTSVARANFLFAHSDETMDSPMYLTGRITNFFDHGFRLTDETGSIDFDYPGKVHLGDIVEVKCQRQASVDEVKILAPCTTDFFIRSDYPNFQRMIVDEKWKKLMKKRSEIVDGIRAFFKERNFLEVETPSIVRLPGMEPYLDVFKTRFEPEKNNKNLKSEDMYLITSPEYALKKLLVAGYEKLFEITKSFRNKETESELHNPEFTLLEWYRAYADYEDTMKDTEELVQSLAVKVNGSPKITYKGKEVDVSTPWPRIKVKDLFKDVGIDYSTFENVEKFRSAVQKKGYKVDEKTPYEDLFFIVFMNEIEPKLGFDKPVIVYEYPASMAALSKKCVHDQKYAERFEAYIAGMELCNAFTELNDPVEQKIRLEMERKERQKLDKDDYPVDQRFIGALELGMPPSSGNALGVDRLVMLLTDTHDIREIIFFPFKDL